MEYMSKQCCVTAGIFLCIAMNAATSLLASSADALIPCNRVHSREIAGAGRISVVGLCRGYGAPNEKWWDANGNPIKPIAEIWVRVPSREASRSIYAIVSFSQQSMIEEHRDIHGGQVLGKCHNILNYELGADEVLWSIGCEIPERNGRFRVYGSVTAAEWKQTYDRYEARTGHPDMLIASAVSEKEWILSLYHCEPMREFRFKAIPPGDNPVITERLTIGQRRNEFVEIHRLEIPNHSDGRFVQSIIDGKMKCVLESREKTPFLFDYLPFLAAEDEESDGDNSRE